ncbi:MAG: zinc-ribbon domain-containing protein [Cypionkella sp.]
MIITCPHCQTRYQVTFEAIGATGRKVQCAHCQKAWSQKPLDPNASDDLDPQVRNVAEDALDDALAGEERRVAAELAAKAAAEGEKAGDSKDAGKLDPAVIRKRQRAFSHRQHVMESQLPLARMRRGARVLGAITLVAMFAGSYLAREQMVDQFPSMAGVYAALGMPVNVVGLEFEKLNTLHTLRDGKDVLIVSADIVGINKAPVVLPAVVVTLLDEHGKGLYEWSVTPEARDLMAGERVGFETQLQMPPVSAARVRLSFTGGGSGRGAAPVQPVSAEEH